MTALRPWRTAHRGSVMASGVAIDLRRVAEAVARRRILSFGSDVECVYRSETRLVAVFGRALRLESEQSAGAPLVRYGNLLSSAPLDAREAKLLEQPETTFLLVEGGEAKGSRLGDLHREDLARWIDLSAFALTRDHRPLGEAEAAPAANVLVPVKEGLGESVGIKGLSNDARDAVRAIARRASTASRRGASSELGGLVASLWRAMKRLAARAAEPAPHQSASTALATSSAFRTSFLSALWTAVSGFVARMVFSSRLASLFGRQHARYLARVLEMFEKNDLDDALRHAIPLNAEVEAGLRQAPPLGGFAPRDDLAIRPGSKSVSASLGLGPSLFQELQARYRRAFEQLVARGEIEKAAFVLVELLNAIEEAVAFLEKHGRIRLAAEIAEARKLAPGLVVRLWFLAGDRKRAIRIARERNAFADAVARLDATDAEAARALRLIWADLLASSGDYAPAVDVIWPVVDARHLAVDWLDRAIDIGGVTGARMLARKARLVPEAFTSVRERVLGLLDDGDAERSVLHALGQELTVEPTPQSRVLAKVTARRIARDARSRDDDRLAQRLIDASGDAILHADVHGPRAATAAEASSIFVRASAATHEGERRVLNEDGFLLAPLDATTAGTDQYDGDASARGVVLGVFDGMGGNSSGAEAHRNAQRPLLATLRRDFTDHAGVPERWGRTLAFGIEHANEAVFSLARSSQAHRGMGCTATVATLSRDKLLIGQVGETRGYVLRGSSLVQVTREHTLVNEYRTMMPEMTQEQLEELPQNVVVRVLGASEQVKPDLVQITVQDQDVLLLCTDGLHGIVPDDDIRRALLERRAPRDAANELVALARGAGAPDNIAVLVARFEGKDLTRDGSDVIATPFVPQTIDGRAIVDGDTLAARRTPLEIRRTADDRGALEIRDVAELPDGRMLVALGEIGVWLLSREGKVQMRFAEPTERIVISDHGDRAILVTARGDHSVRLSRLDVLGRRVRYWCDVPLMSYAPDFDGSTWFVGRAAFLFAVDATAEGWEHTFEVDHADAAILQIRRSKTELDVWFDDGVGSGEIWTFGMPPVTLRSRKRIATEERAPVGKINEAGGFVGWYRQHDREFRARSFIHGAWNDLPATSTSLPALPALTDHWIALPVHTVNAVEIQLLDTANRIERGRIVLEGTDHDVGIRFQGDHLLVFDRRGRVLVVSLESGAVVREHRLT